MKKMIVILSLILSIIEGLNAKPVAHVNVSFDVEIGRRKKACDGIWLCIKNIKSDFDVTLEGMISQGHGLVLDDDGSLYLAINSLMVKKQDVSKYNTLLTGYLYLDSEEELPSNVLIQLGYTGKNTFPSGKYAVTNNGDYFMVKLN